MTYKIVIRGVSKQLIDCFDLLVDAGNIFGSVESRNLYVSISVGYEFTTFVEFIELLVEVSQEDF